MLLGICQALLREFGDDWGMLSTIDCTPQKISIDRHNSNIKQTRFYGCLVVVVVAAVAAVAVVAVVVSAGHWNYSNSRMALMIFSKFSGWFIPPKKHTDQTPLFTSGGMILVWLDVKRLLDVCLCPRLSPFSEVPGETAGSCLSKLTSKTPHKNIRNPSMLSLKRGFAWKHKLKCPFFLGNWIAGVRDVSSRWKLTACFPGQ